MILALSPAAHHALTVHAQQLLTLLLSDATVLRGQVTAWLIHAVELVQTPQDKALQEAHLASLLAAATPRRGRRPAKVRTVGVGKRSRGAAR